MNDKNIKFIKLSIATFYLLASFWVSYLIFSRGFIHKGMEFSVDSETENTFMILTVCTLLSGVCVLFLGLLSMFTNFVFVRLIYADEIKQGAFFLINKKRKEKNTDVKDTELETDTYPEAQDTKVIEHGTK